MPKVGMRMVKSAIAALIVGIIYCFLPTRNPFYAVIAAIYSMRIDPQSSFASFRNRSVATLAGGVLGYLALLFMNDFLSNWGKNISYVFAILWVIPLMYLMVTLKLPDCAYLTCVVFFSVTITQKTTEMDAALFVFDRMLDTEIGAIAAVLVNAFHLPHKKNPSTFFLVSLENGLGNKFGKISPAHQISIKNILHQGASISLFSWMTPPKVIEVCKCLEFTFPIFLLGGTAAFDLKQGKYLYTNSLNKELCSSLENYLDKRKSPFFVLSVDHHLLLLYYKNLSCKGFELFFEDQKNQSYQSIIHGEIREDQEHLGYIVIIENENYKSWKEEWDHFQDRDAFQYHLLPDFEEDGYIAILIISSNVTPDWIWDKQKKFYPELTSFVSIPENTYSSEKETISVIRKSFHQKSPTKV